ncbi:MAG: hypothetical protein VKJ24_18795 [Synechococcales bacterium]|nr:hypothetical protein [Synechococcales bacterium]
MNSSSALPDLGAGNAVAYLASSGSVAEFQASSRYVPEWGNEFLSLFPHRFDYIWAMHPQIGEAVVWQTERRHPLSDRAILERQRLYGVRFGSTTGYLMLDIDRQSCYHPQQDPLAIQRLVESLEPLRLVGYVAITSSSSGGLHLYFPFDTVQKSWQVAIAVTHLLETAGYAIAPGQLEVFPNPKSFLPGNTPSLYNAHRLPLQLGSYLLDRDFEPMGYSQVAFVRAWKFSVAKNEFNEVALRRILRLAKKRFVQLSGKADKFLNDLNTEIELGWTGHGQTNRLLGRIALRGYVFHHVLHGGLPLTGDALIDHIAETARSLPGYFDWCQHQHEICDRATEWARCVESSHYFPYNYSHRKQRSPSDQSIALAADQEHDRESDRMVDQPVDQRIVWNQKQSESAREKIRNAIADLLNQNALPSQITARFDRLTSYGIGGSSLYRHKDLWHPTHLPTHLPTELNTTTHPNTHQSYTSLLDENGRNFSEVDQSNSYSGSSDSQSNVLPLQDHTVSITGSLSPSQQVAASHPEQPVAEFPIAEFPIAEFTVDELLLHDRPMDDRPMDDRPMDEVLVVEWFAGGLIFCLSQLASIMFSSRDFSSKAVPSFPFGVGAKLLVSTVAAETNVEIISAQKIN